MAILSEKQKEPDIRKRLSIELCNNFVKRLNPAQNRETKVGALIAIKNLISKSKIDDSFLFSYLVDSIVDPDKEIRQLVIKIIKEVTNAEIHELLELKLKETNNEIKKEISTLLDGLKN